MDVHACMCACTYCCTFSTTVLKSPVCIHTYSTHTYYSVCVEMSACCFMLKLMYTGSETGIYSYPILTWH